MLWTPSFSVLILICHSFSCCCFLPLDPVFYFGNTQYQVDESDGFVEVQVWRTGTDLSKAGTVTARSRKTEPVSAEGVWLLTASCSDSFKPHRTTDWSQQPVSVCVSELSVCQEVSTMGILFGWPEECKHFFWLMEEKNLAFSLRVFLLIIVGAVQYCEENDNLPRDTLSGMHSDCSLCWEALWAPDWLHFS